ncbi:MAG: Gfo/Idh/MocA family oxidoreductase [Acidimicrobiia bacterium]
MGETGVVIVGTGFGCHTHLRAIRGAGLSVSALVGRDPERTKARAQRFDVPLATTSLAEALEAPGVVAVAVVTPPYTHHELVLEAVSAGKHVVCEKPFARDVAEAREMLAAADRAGVVHLLGTEFRFGTGQALSNRLIAAGAIGEPRIATFLMLMPLLADPAAEVPDWWASSEAGGGWLGAHASHVVDNVRNTFGEFEGVSASLSSTAPRAMTADDGFSILFRTRSGVEGIMQSSAGTWGPPAILRRYSGTKGTLWFEGDDIWIADAEGQRKVEPPADLLTAPPEAPPTDFMVTAYDWMHAHGTDLGPYTRLYEVFRDTIEGKQLPADPVPATFADAVADMEVMDAIRRSVAERSWVEIPARG